MPRVENSDNYFPRTTETHMQKIEHHFQTQKQIPSAQPTGIQEIKLHSLMQIYILFQIPKYKNKEI